MEPELCKKCGRRLSCSLRDAVCYGDGRSFQPVISISYCSRFYQQYCPKERKDVEVDLIAL